MWFSRLRKEGGGEEGKRRQRHGTEGLRKRKNYFWALNLKKENFILLHSLKNRKKEEEAFVMRPSLPGNVASHA